LETILAAAHSSWKLLGLELKTMVSMTRWLELSIPWELTRLHVGVEKGLSTSSNNKVETD
jgi:hypothetical protein